MNSLLRINLAVCLLSQIVGVVEASFAGDLSCDSPWYKKSITCKATHFSPSTNFKLLCRKKESEKDIYPSKTLKPKLLPEGGNYTVTITLSFSQYGAYICCARGDAYALVFPHKEICKTVTVGTRYPAALGAIIVSILIPGLVIFTVCFIAIFSCCYWRKIPFLRRQFSKSSQGRAKPKKIPASAYPHQPAVQCTDGYSPDHGDDGEIAPLQSEVRIHVEPATETDNKEEESADSNYASQETEDATKQKPEDESRIEPIDTQHEPDEREALA